jgi:hypothetical protein
MTVKNHWSDPEFGVILGGAVIVVAVAIVGVSAYSFLKPVAAPSAPLSAVSLNVSNVYEIQPSDSTASFVVDTAGLHRDSGA